MSIKVANTIPQTTDRLDFKRVIEDTQNQVLFRKSCIESLTLFDRPSASMLELTGKDPSLKSYLVYRNTMLCGLLMYKREEESQRKITVFCLKTINVAPAQKDTILNKMFERILSDATDSNCTTIQAVVGERDDEGKAFFTNKGFYQASSTGTTTTSSLKELHFIKTLKVQSEKQEDLSKKRDYTESSSSDSVAPQPYSQQVSSRGYVEQKKGAIPPQKTQKMEPQASFQKPLDATLKEPYLSFILQGRKTIEGRINSGMFLRVRAGSRIHFFNHMKEVTCKVIAVRKYRSFKEMLEKEGVAPCLPNVRSLEEAVRIYDSIPGYTERANKSGILAIQIAKE